MCAPSERHGFLLPKEKEQPAAFVVGAVSVNLEGLLRALELGMPWNEVFVHT